jgi:hypothetical protein
MARSSGEGSPLSRRRLAGTSNAAVLSRRTRLVGRGLSSQRSSWTGRQHRTCIECPRSTISEFYGKGELMAPITLEKVTKVYPNGFKAVDELNLGRR